MDRLQANEMFLTIAEHGSLTAAARVLDVSLPTVVRALAALENSLGVRLFNRTTRRLSITQEGRIYQSHATAIRAAVSESERAIGRAQAEPSGTLTVTAPVMFGQMYVAPLLVKYVKAYPKVDLNLVLLDRLVNLVEEGIDVAVRIAPQPDSTLVARRVADIRQVIAASPDFLRGCRRPRTPHDLAAIPCIRASGIGEPGVWDFSVNGKRQQVAVRGAIQCNSIGAALACCIAGSGIGRFLHYQVSPAVSRGELTLLLERFEPKSRPLSIVYPKNRLGSVRVSSFIELFAIELKRILSKPDGDGCAADAGPASHQKTE